ncbi:MAG: L,D-transpeptidase, partial [Candidatus Nanoarchaeia archaeon]
GAIYEKRKRVLFFYAHDYPQLKIKKGDVIKWNNTFTPEGKPIGYKVPYQKIRGIGMKIKRPTDGYTYIDYVIHTALDDHTVGFAVSGGCLRVRMEDMLRLYDIIEPQKDDGPIKEIPLKINYDLVEISNGEVILHANIYNKKIDYVNEFKKLVAKQGMEDRFDYERITEIFKKADEDFKNAYKEVRARSLKSFPGNYLPPQLRERLHRTFKLSDLETKVVKN